MEKSSLQEIRRVKPKTTSIKIDMLPPEEEVENQPTEWKNDFTENWYDATKSIKEQIKKEKMSKKRLNRRKIRTSGSLSYL